MINIFRGQVPILVNPKAIAKHTQLTVLRDHKLKQIMDQADEQKKKNARDAAAAAAAKKEADAKKKEADAKKRDDAGTAPGPKPTKPKTGN